MEFKLTYFWAAVHNFGHYIMEALLECYEEGNNNNIQTFTHEESVINRQKGKV